MAAKAYSPAHITGLFKIYRNGSTGAGINLEKGVETTVYVKKAEKQQIKIFINQKKARAPTSKNLVKKFLGLKKGKHSVTVKHTTELPIGYGLGLSAAGALSLALALNKALETGLDKKECVMLAQRAEIEEGTGLGDVIAEQFSGLIIGKKPYPSTAVEKIPLEKKFVVCGFFAPLNTRKIIRNKNWVKKINSAGEKCMRQLNRNKTAENFIKSSNRFCVESGLADKKIRKIISELPDSSMAMLGRTVFMITGNPKSAGKEMHKYTRRVAVSGIAAKGAALR